MATAQPALNFAQPAGRDAIRIVPLNVPGGVMTPIVRSRAQHPRTSVGCAARADDGGPD